MSDRRTLTGLTGLAALAAFALVALLVGLGWGPLRDLDRSTTRTLTDGVDPQSGWITGWRLVSVIGAPVGLELVAVAAGLALFFSGRRRAGLFAAVTVPGSSLLNTAVKSVADRARPVTDGVFVDANGSSFPSGHAMTSAAAAGVVVLVLYSLRQRWSAGVVAAAVAVPVVVGFSRLALGVHYLSDVLGGCLLALAWVMGTARLVLSAPVSPPTRR